MDKKFDPRVLSENITSLKARFQEIKDNLEQATEKDTERFNEQDVTDFKGFLAELERENLKRIHDYFNQV